MGHSQEITEICGEIVARSEELNGIISGPHIYVNIYIACADRSQMDRAPSSSALAM